MFQCSLSGQRFGGFWRARRRLLVLRVCSYSGEPGATSKQSGKVGKKPQSKYANAKYYIMTERGVVTWYTHTFLQSENRVTVVRLGEQGRHTNTLKHFRYHM